MNRPIPQQPKPAISPTKTIAAVPISTSIQIVSTYALSYILDALQTKILQPFPEKSSKIFAQPAAA
jgi:hypothetical protein